MALDRLVAQLDRLRQLADERALCRAAVEQLRPARSGSPPAKRSARRYWAAASRCAPSDAARSRGRRREPLDGFGVGRRLGVVREPVEVHDAVGRRGERPPARARCSADPSIRRQRLLDRQPRKLMPEGDAVPAGTSMPGPEALLEAVDRRAGERLEQPQLGCVGDDRDRVEQRSRAGPTAALRARAPRRARSAASRSGPAASTSVTKNGFPPVTRWSACPSTPCGSASSATAARRQRLDPHPLDRVAAPAPRAPSAADACGRARRPGS